MPSVEQQIEQSRAKKKALIKKSILGFFVVLFVGVAGVLLVSFFTHCVQRGEKPHGTDRQRLANQQPRNTKSAGYRI
ncbi:hypothetical protein ALT785_390121 [Alteromonas infernus]